MRADGAEAARYRSARDPDGRANVALFTPAVFARRTPVSREEWHATASREGVEFLQRYVPARRVVAFTRAQFEVKGRPALSGTVTLQNREQLCGVASSLMRRILVDHPDNARR